MSLTAKKAICEVLKEAGEPLHYEKITDRMLERGLWRTGGKTPSKTVYAELLRDIKKRGSASLFRKVGPGRFTLNQQPQPSLAPTKAPRQPVVEPSQAKPLSFLDAAERILRESGPNQPMTYVEITKRAMARGLIQTQGLTPAASLSGQVGVDIRRREARGENQRFVRPARGKVGLAPSLPVAVADQIEEQNRNVRAQLLERAKQGSPDDFEQTVGALLEAMGFEGVEVTPSTGDGGIDVRGTLVVGDVVRLRMAVQAKRWKNNVQKPVVQQVRGSLSAHEQGLIITTSGFSQGAREEAKRPDASPVALMDGEQLARLLAENEIGAKRAKYDLWRLLESEEPLA